MPMAVAIPQQNLSCVAKAIQTPMAGEYPSPMPPGVSPANTQWKREPDQNSVQN
ncbi:hypothetical protein FHS27_004558 [Rhodopirellula rubra]|uniref:Uncharacterized protein n=1 Tax=Aporhodopirellula rubra TaxID=980271 RepID=A0A7W5E244_9BACT|nr:hypothetical protein [Aporhodopirellula rubra]MBB3208726.1 hypothetical protein [Aporhodopirellula rubra]